MEHTFLNSLNNEQKEAATMLDGPILIIAGAGTGKTHTLTARVSYMLEQGIPGGNILLVTFTNKAAEEMKERILKETGGSGSDITACTFHSFCCTFLRSYMSYINRTSIWQALFGENDFQGILLKNDFRILSSAEQGDIMDFLRKEYISAKNKELEKKGESKLISKSVLTSKALLTLWSDYANEEIVHLKRLDTYIRQAFDDKDVADQATSILRAYARYKIVRNMVDYDDLLMYAWTILSASSGIRKKADAKYKYIMCDEYQDTNTIQDAILDLLSKDNKNLCVCGDDNQSIYRFRGARIENILSFKERYPDCHMVKLFRNYRSTQEILDLSNVMMHHATEGIQKDLKGQAHGEMPAIRCVMNDQDAASIIISDIAEAHRQGCPYKDFGILVRQSRQAATLETLLNYRNIPYKKFGGIKFLELSVVRDLLAYFQVIANPKDELAYLRIAKQFPELGNKRGADFAAAAICMDGEELKKKYRSEKIIHHRSVREIVDLLRDLKEMPYSEMMPFLFKDYQERQEAIIAEGSSDKKEELLESLHAGLEEAEPLLDIAKQYMDCSTFVEAIVLEQNVEPDDTEEDYVSISTVHSAKGLEYRCVYLLDTSDAFYSRNERGTEEDCEDLRVLYVALTRAKEQLTIFINETAPFYAAQEQSLTHHLIYDDVLECAHTDPEIPIAGNYGTAALKFA